MRIGRPILAFLVALSLALLPMAGAFVVANEEPIASDVAVASATAATMGRCQPTM